MEKVPFADRTKAVKRILIEMFGKEAVKSVRKGSGTASGWVDAEIEVKREPCACEGWKCPKRVEAQHELSEKVAAARKRIHDEVELGIWYCDDGACQVEHDELMIRSRIVEEEKIKA